MHETENQDGGAAERRGPHDLPREQRDTSGRFTYGNPYAWRPGESGNPSGLSRQALVSREIRRLLNEGGAEEVAESLFGIVRRGGAGAVEAARLLLERTEGRVAQVHRLEVPRPKRIVLEGGTLAPACPTVESRRAPEDIS